MNKKYIDLKVTFDDEGYLKSTYVEHFDKNSKYEGCISLERLDDKKFSYEGFVANSELRGADSLIPKTAVSTTKNFLSRDVRKITTVSENKGKEDIVIEFSGDTLPFGMEKLMSKLLYAETKENLRSEDRSLITALGQKEAVKATKEFKSPN